MKSAPGVVKQAVSKNGNLSQLKTNKPVEVAGETEPFIAVEGVVGTPEDGVALANPRLCSV